MGSFLSASLDGRTFVEPSWVVSGTGKGCGVCGQVADVLAASISGE